MTIVIVVAASQHSRKQCSMVDMEVDDVEDSEIICVGFWGERHHMNFWGHLFAHTHIFTYFTRYLKAHFQTQLKSALQWSIHTPYNEDNCLFHDNIPLMTPSSRRIHLLTSNMAAPPPTFSLAAFFGAQPPDPHLSLYEAASWSYLMTLLHLHRPRSVPNHHW